MMLELPPIGSSHAPTSCLCTGGNGSGHVALLLVVQCRHAVAAPAGSRSATIASVSGWRAARRVAEPARQCGRSHKVEFASRERETAPGLRHMTTFDLDLTI